MDAPAVIYALKWLIHDTFRQTLSSRVFWILLALSGVCIVFCLGISVEGGAIRDGNEFYHPKTNKLLGSGDNAGNVSLLFGTFSYPFRRTAEDQVQFLLSIFASWVAGTVGILMMLVWTAGFIPESLHPSAASVMLAKPTPRWLFLAGKFLGVICFVALHATIFFFGTWLAFGVKTEFWYPAYLMGIPLMVFHFAVIYSFSMMLAVLTRSTTACVVGTVVFWFVCYAVNYGRHFAVVYSDLNPNAPKLPEFTLFLADASYWLLPKPIDFTLMFEKSLVLNESMNTQSASPPFKNMLEKNLFHPIPVVLTSCIFPAFALWASASQLSKTDY